MTKIFKITRAAVIVLCAVYLLGYVFVLARGKQIIVDKLQRYTGQQIKVDAVVLRLPFVFEINGLEVPGQFTAKRLRLRPSFIGLLTNKILLYEITFIKPSFVYDRGKTAVPAPGSAAAGKTCPVREIPALSPGDFFFKKLAIYDGTVTFTDNRVNQGAGQIKITCDQLNLELVNTYEFPDSIITRFKLNASVPWEKSQTRGSVQAQGWADIFQKDMQAKLVIKDIDGVYLQPYFADWIDLGKTGIEKAKLNFTSDITSLRNNVTAASHFELTEVEFKQKEPEQEESRGEKIAQAVLGILKGLDQGNIVLDFTLKTKMDDLEFGLAPIRCALEEKIAMARRNRGLNAESVILFPGRMVTGTVQSFAVASKSLLDSLLGVGKELGRSVGASFRKDKTTANQTQSSR